MEVGGYTSAAVGATLLVFAAMKGEKLRDVESQIRENCNTNQDPILCTDLTLTQFTNLQSKGETYATQANIFLITGSVLTVAGIGMLLFEILKPSNEIAGHNSNFPLKNLSAFELDFMGSATWLRHTIEF